eukprot:scaffold328920_cov52-Tisochrysis_lutea.AAC.8
MQAQWSQPASSQPTDGATTSPASLSSSVPHLQHVICGPLAGSSTSGSSSSSSIYRTTTREPGTLVHVRPRTVRTAERVRVSAAAAFTATHPWMAPSSSRVSLSRTSHMCPSSPTICVPRGRLAAAVAGSAWLGSTASKPRISSHRTGAESSMSGSPRLRVALAMATHQPSACCTCTGSPGMGAQPRGR